MTKEQWNTICERFQAGEFAISDHAIIKARKDGIDPETVTKLAWVAVHGKIIEEYPERERVLVYAEIPAESLPVHIVVEYAFSEEPVIVTAYVPDSCEWTKSQRRK